MTSSYDEMAPHEQALVNVLSVFAGGFPLDGARAVAGSVGIPADVVPEWLASLAMRSLVVQEDTTSPRYRLPEPVGKRGQKALAGSSEQDTVRTAHLDWARALAEEGAAALEGADQPRWLETLEREHDNFRAALLWGTARRDCEAALALAGALGRFWEVRGHVAEGRRWLEVATRQNPGASPSVRAMAANSAGLLAFRARDYAAARTIYEESLAVHWDMGDRLGSAGVLHSLGNLAFQQRDWDEARRLFEESLSIGRELRDDRVIAASLTNLGAVADVHNDPATARLLYQEALATWRALGDAYNAAAVLANLVNVAMLLNDDEAARQFGTETLDARRLLGDRRGMASALRQLSVVARRQGDVDAVRAYEREAAQLLRTSEGGWLARLRRRS